MMDMKYEGIKKW